MMDHESAIPTSAPDSVTVTPVSVGMAMLSEVLRKTSAPVNPWVQRCYDKGPVTESGLSIAPPSRDTETKPNV